MNEINVGKPNGKLLFGCDFFNLMRFMEIPGKENEGYSQEKQYVAVTDAVMGFFLIQWGFSVDEIDSSNELFWKKLNENKLDDNINKVIDRIFDFVKNNKVDQEKLIIQMCAIANMNEDVSQDELGLIKYMQEKFDLRPSEFQSLVAKGIDWSMAINFIGKKYIESGIAVKK